MKARFKATAELNTNAGLKAKFVVEPNADFITRGAVRSILEWSRKRRWNLDCVGVAGQCDSRVVGRE